MSKKVVLAGACRTAIGTMGGELSTVPAPELGAIVIKEALKRAGVAPEAVDQVYMGCVIQAGLGQNVARQMSIKAGLPIEVPAVTLNVVCGSGLQCVNAAAQMILAGDADIVVAGGAENMSAAPYALKNARYGYRMGNAPMIDTMVNDALWDAFNNYHMGITAACKGEEEYRAANPGRGKECPDHRSSIRGRGDGSGTAGKLEPGTDGGWPGRVSAEPASERNGSKNSGQHISGAGIHQHLHGRAGGVSMASGDQPFRKSGNADIDICYKRRECDCADLVHADRQQWKLRVSCG